MSTLARQLDMPFTKPFANLREQFYLEQPLLFIIDALDESGDKTSRAEIANCLCQIVNLTSRLKRVFVTSRPLPELARAFRSSHSASSVTSFDLSWQVDTNSVIYLLVV